MPKIAKQSEKLRRQSRVGTAHHEAGHAVACHYSPLSGKTVLLTMDPADLAAGNARQPPEKRAAGFHRTGKTLPAVVRSRVDADALDAKLVCTMGGLAADLIHERRPLTALAALAGFWCGAGSDYAAALDLAQKASFDAQAVIRDCEAEADFDAAVRRIGAEHVAALRGRVEAALATAYTLLRERWPVVQAVARALLLRGSLSGDEVRAIIERVGVRRA